MCYFNHLICKGLHRFTNSILMSSGFRQNLTLRINSCFFESYPSCQFEEQSHEIVSLGLVHIWSADDKSNSRVYRQHRLLSDSSSQTKAMALGYEIGFLIGRLGWTKLYLCQDMPAAVPIFCMKFYVGFEFVSWTYSREYLEVCLDRKL